MSNPIHLLARAVNENLSEILRDFKKFTSKQIIKAIEDNERESRKDWMLKVFKEQGEKNIRNKEYQFWRQNNQPKGML
jgi:putative transposase